MENRPYEAIINRFDKPDTFLYCDPPYYGYEDYYGKGVFERDDFQKLRDILGAIKGKFIMSINDNDAIRKLYNGFNIEVVETTYMAGGATKKRELKSC